MLRGICKVFFVLTYPPNNSNLALVKENTMTLIKWKQRAAQVKDYENLILNGYTPTDIDFIYDISGRRYVIGELKAVGAPMPEGQRRMLQYLAQNLVAAGCDVCVMVAEHNTRADEFIDVGHAVIVKCTTVKHGNTYTDRYIGMEVIDACNDFLEIGAAD
jgi:hypothetical protein